jgi:hypothetical protein
MTREDLINMALGAKAKVSSNPEKWDVLEFDSASLERFARLIAANTVANIDPSKLMSFQEGFEAGRVAEREGCAKWADLVAREIDNTNNTASYIASGIRERGEK